MPRVFISRELRADSPFAALAADTQWIVQAESLVDFTIVPLTGGMPVADWLFFYSTRGVQFFLAQAQPPRGIRLAAMGPGTAAALQREGYTPDFVGIGEPSATADLFQPLAKRQHVVFIQARHSRRAVQQRLDPTIQSTERIVYDNIPKKKLNILPCDYLVFTSPLNVQAYHQCYAWSPAVRVVSIGSTTSAALAETGCECYRQAAESSEMGLLRCLLDWHRLADDT